MCQYFVSDDAERATVVGYLSATDKDFGKNAEISYSLSNEFSNYFVYNKVTGSVKVNVKLPLVNQTAKSINFTITASDKGTPQFSTSLSCSVIISGGNKHAPQLLHDATITEILPAMVPARYKVIQINATDSDIGPDDEISYLIISGDSNSEFTISDKGLLSTKKALQSDSYVLVVEISDKASPAKRKSINCTINIFIQGKQLIPVIKTNLGIALDGNYDEVVKPNKQGFIDNFTDNFIQREKTYGRDVGIIAIAVRPGSIIVNMDIEHKETEKDIIINQLENDLKAGTFTFNYNGTKLAAKKSLLVDDEETMTTKEADDDNTTLIITVVTAVLGTLVLIVIIIFAVCYCKKKREDRPKTTKKNMADFISGEKGTGRTSPIHYHMEETKINPLSNQHMHSGITNSSYSRQESISYKEVEEQDGGSIASGNESHLNLIAGAPSLDGLEVAVLDGMDKQVYCF